MYLWIVFTDKYGLITFDGNYSCNYVQSLLKLNGCKNYELHLTNEDTIRFFCENYLEGCYELEYIGDIN